MEKDMDRFCRLVGDLIADEGTAAYTSYPKLLADAPKDLVNRIKKIKKQEAIHQRILQRIEKKYCLRRLLI